MVRLLPGMLFFVYTFAAGAAGESAQTITVDGILYSADDFSSPLLDSSAKLNIKILNPNKTCILYEEEQTVNTTNSEGRFTVQVGSAKNAGKRAGDDPNHRMIDVLQNVAPIAATNTGCAGGQYNPLSGDVRHIRVTLTPSATNVPVAMEPDMQIGSVPNALVCESVQGLDKNKLAEFGTHINANMTAANLLKLFNNSDVGSLHNHDGKYATLSNSQSINLGAQQTLGLGRFTTAQEGMLSLNATTDVGKMWMNSDTGKIMYWDGMSAVEVGSGAGGVVNSVFGRSGNVTAQNGDYTASQVTNVAAGNISSTTVQTALNELDAEKVQKTGDTMSGILNMGSNRITNVTDPSSAQDVATKAYVDAQVGGSGDDLGDHVATQNIELGPNWLSGDGDNEGIYVDGDGKVGIGTAAPGFPLEVASANALSPATMKDTLTLTDSTPNGSAAAGAGSGIRFRAQTNFGNTTVAGIWAETSGTSTQGNLYFATRNTGGTVTPQITLIPSGNIGIGTTNPGFRLEVNGGTKSGTLQLSAASGYLEWGTGATTGIYRTGDNIALYTAGSNRILVGSGGGLSVGTTYTGSVPPADGLIVQGNVGIGTTSPVAVLDVNGNIKIANSSTTCNATHEGEMRYDTGTHALYFCSDTGWKEVGDAAAAGVVSIFGRSGTVVADNGDYTASQVTNVAAGNISATTVQAALNELDAEKVAKAGDTMAGPLAMSTNKITGLGDPTAAQDAATKNYVDGRLLGNTLSSPGGGQVGQAIRWNGGGTAWEYYTPASGDVSSATEIIAGDGLTGGGDLSTNRTLAVDLDTDPGLEFSAGKLRVRAGTGLTRTSAGINVSYGTSVGTATQGNDARLPSATCASGNKMRWDGSAWQCEVDASTDSTKVAKAGDTMTGTLNLPANGLVAGTDQLVLSGGNVGIGTANPGEKLDVNGAVKLGAAAGTADGTIRWTGTDFEGRKGGSWVSMTGSSGSAAPTSFAVHKNGTSQTVTTNTWTKLTWSTERFDVGNMFANDRFTPTIAGKYFFQAQTYCSDGVTSCQLAFYKNGSLYNYGYQKTANGMPNVSTLIDMNGTTDYVEVYVYNQGGTSINGGSDVSFFAGYLTSSTTVPNAGTGTAGYLPLWSDSTTLGNSPLAVSSGNVGIGTTTPSTKLMIGADGAIATTEKALTDAATINVNWRNGNQQFVVLGGNRTINFSNYVAGQTLRLIVCQDATGLRTATWDAAVLWNGGAAPTLTSAADKCDVLTFLATDAPGSLKIFGSSVLNF